MCIKYVDFPDEAKSLSMTQEDMGALVEFLDEKSEMADKGLAYTETLRFFALSGYLPLLRHLLNTDFSDIPIEVRNSARDRALISAASEGYDDCVKFLHENGADPSVSGDFSCVKTTVLATRISNPFLVKPKDDALVYAVLSGSIDTVKYLVEVAGSNVCAHLGYVLVNALNGGVENIVKYLLDKGALIDDSNACGVAYAISSKGKGEHPKKPRALLECLFNKQPHAKDYKHQLPKRGPVSLLAYAFYHGDFDTINYLKEIGLAFLTKINGTGLSELSLALIDVLGQTSGMGPGRLSETQVLELVKYLIEDLHAKPSLNAGVGQANILDLADKFKTGSLMQYLVSAVVDKDPDFSKEILKFIGSSPSTSNKHDKAIKAIRIQDLKQLYESSSEKLPVPYKAFWDYSRLDVLKYFVKELNVDLRPFFSVHDLKFPYKTNDIDSLIFLFDVVGIELGSDELETLTNGIVSFHADSDVEAYINTKINQVKERELLAEKKASVIKSHPTLDFMVEAEAESSVNDHAPFHAELITPMTEVLTKIEVVSMNPDLKLSLNTTKIGFSLGLKDVSLSLTFLVFTYAAVLALGFATAISTSVLSVLLLTAGVLGLFARNLSELMYVPERIQGRQAVSQEEMSGKEGAECTCLSTVVNFSPRLLQAMSVKLPFNSDNNVQETSPCSYSFNR